MSAIKIQYVNVKISFHVQVEHKKNIELKTGNTIKK